MIIKPFTPRAASDPRNAAGVQAERQMAHYLDRYFRDSKRHLLLHDLRLKHDGEVAQIDHLVVHSFGVAIVESKSVSTSVRITRAGEWERRSGKTWQGMPNPLLQGDRQGMVLKRLLTANTEALLDKIALGFNQGTFHHMAIDAFAAISDQGTISRARVDQAPKAMKADAIPPAVEELVAGYRKATSLLSPSLRSFAEAPRDFNEREMLRIAHFLRTRHTPRTTGLNEDQHLTIEPTSASAETEKPVRLTCSACGSTNLTPKIGPYGPYGECASCGKNTAAKANCPSCGKKIRLERAPKGFAGACKDCGSRAQVDVGTGQSSP